MTEYTKCKIARVLHHIFAFIYFIPISFYSFFIAGLYYSPIELTWKYYNKKRFFIKANDYADYIVCFLNVIAFLIIFSVLTYMLICFPFHIITALLFIIFFYVLTHYLYIGINWIIKYSKQYNSYKK